jgi:hypothetical protein
MVLEADFLTIFEAQVCISFVYLLLQTFELGWVLEQGVEDG